MKSTIIILKITFLALKSIDVVYFILILYFFHKFLEQLKGNLEQILLCL